MPYANEHACRLRDPGAFKPDSFRRTQRKHGSKVYSVIVGRLKGQDTMTDQAYRYAKDTWKATEAQSHCKEHGGTFEVAATIDADDPVVRRTAMIQERIGLVRGIDKDARTITGYASTREVDRCGTVIEPSAFAKDLPRFLKERHLFAAAHHYVNAAGEPTIIGKVVDATIDDKGLLAVFKFDRDELSERWWQKYLIGTLKAFSIGFIPLAWENRKIKKDAEHDDEEEITVYTEVELLEISAVPIPANRESVVTAGFDRDAVAALTERIGQLEATLATLIGRAKDGAGTTRDLIHELRNEMLRQFSVLIGDGAAGPRSSRAGGIASGGEHQRAAGLFEAVTGK